MESFGKMAESADTVGTLELPALNDAGTGLSERTVEYLSGCKREPLWLRNSRMTALRRYLDTPRTLDWAPRELNELPLEELRYYSEPDMRGDSGEALLQSLGANEERGDYLGGAMVQVDGGVVYTDIMDSWTDKGAVFVDSTTGLRDYPDLFRPHFGSIVGMDENPYTRLNGAVFSGGSFIFVPPGVKLTAPMKCFMHLQAEGGSQFGRTLVVLGAGAEVTFFESCTSSGGTKAALHCSVGEFVVGEGARLNYVAFQSWQDNVVNLSILRAKLARNASVQWLDCTVGGRLVMKYPCSILEGEGASAEAVTISLARGSQHHDTGAKMLHRANRTRSNIQSKSICMDRSLAGYRGLVDIPKTVSGCRNNTVCDAMLMDPHSRTQSFPAISARGLGNSVQHEASVFKVDADQVFYMAQRGIPEKVARSLIVNGFADDVVKRFPLRYSMEIRRLLDLELSGKVG